MNAGTNRIRAVRAHLGVVVAVAAVAVPARAQAIYVDAEGKSHPQSFSLPYAFVNDGFGLAAGYVYGGTGFPQPQSSMLATVIGGTAPSAAGMLFARDLNPGIERLFIDPLVSLGYYGKNDVYTDGNPKFTNERAGSNGSDKNDFIEGAGTDNLVKARFKYVLPIGRGADRVIDTYEVQRGIPVIGSTAPKSLDPLESGKTYLELAPFYRKLDVSSDNAPNIDLATNGAEASLFWDNRDYFANPTAGQSVRFKGIEDFGWFISTTSWTALQAEADQYFDLGSTETFRQRVLAFDFWTSYSPSWDETASGTVDHGPPPFYGSSLGGLWRMKGYPVQRFSDKAAIYYSAELRLMPEWNPVPSWPWLQDKLAVQWVEFVPFFELGRVAPTWQIDTLHSSMKWDVGLGIRANARGLVIRIDTAVSPEGLGIRMMIGHSFQF